MLYLSSWRDLQRWSQATAFWLFDKPEITRLPIPTNVETAPGSRTGTDFPPIAAGARKKAYRTKQPHKSWHATVGTVAGIHTVETTSRVLVSLHSHSPFWGRVTTHVIGSLVVVARVLLRVVEASLAAGAPLLAGMPFIFL